MADRELTIRIRGKNETRGAFDEVMNGAKSTKGAFEGVQAQTKQLTAGFSETQAAGNRLSLTLMQLADAQRRLAAESDPAKQAALKVEIDNLSRSAQKYSQDIDKAGDETLETGGQMDKLVGVAKTLGGALAFKQIAQTAIELGNLGAQAKRTETAFTAISGGAINATANLNAMIEATGGAISRTEAMAQASRLLQMGLATNSEELGNMTEMAVTLGRAMGRDANTAIEEFSLLLANQSILRLDTFGISAAKVRTRIEELQAANQGLSRETAFLTAVQEIGTEAMNRLGDSALDAAGKAEQTTAAFADLKVEIGKRLADGLAGGNTVLGKFIRQWGDNLRVMNDNSSGIGVLQANLAMLGDFLGSNNTAFDKYRRAQELAAKATEAGIEASRDFADVGTNSVAPSVRKAAEHLNDWYQRTRDSERATLGLEGVLYDSAAAFDDYNRAVNGSTDHMGDFTREQEKAAEAAALVEEQYDTLLITMRSGLSDEFEDYREKTAELADEAGTLSARIAELEGKSWLSKAEIAELDKAKTKLQENRQEVDNLAAAHLEATGKILFGFAQQEAAADGVITQEEYEALAALGKEYGILDETAAEALTQVKGYMEDVRSGTVDAETAAEDLRNEVMLLGREGSESLTGLIASGEATRQKFEEIGLSADAAQIAIDRMHGKTLDMEINWVERNRPTGPDGASVSGRPEIGWNATGGDYKVTKPTVFGAGDAGPERAIFIPQGEPGYDAPTAAMAAAGYAEGHGAGVGGNTWTGNIIVQGAGDPAATAAAVEQRLRDRGIIPQVALR